MLTLDDKYWEDTICCPTNICSMERKVLWSIWNVIMSTPFDKRDEHWDHACDNVRRILNETR